MLEPMGNFRDWTRERVVAHWEKILATPQLPPLSHEFARAALSVLRGFEKSIEEPIREPGAEG